MNFEQAMEIMEQAVQMAVKGCQKIDDMKAILIAWDTVKPCIKEPPVPVKEVNEDEHHEGNA